MNDTILQTFDLHLRPSGISRRFSAAALLPTHQNFDLEAHLCAICFDQRSASRICFSLSSRSGDTRLREKLCLGLNSNHVVSKRFRHRATLNRIC